MTKIPNSFVIARKLTCIDCEVYVNTWDERDLHYTNEIEYFFISVNSFGRFNGILLA